MLQKLLQDRAVPLISSTDAEEMRALQTEYKEILLREEYGRPLPEPDSVSFEIDPDKKPYKRFAAGKATSTPIIAHTVIGEKEFSFSFQSVIPNKYGKFPFVIHNDFYRGLPTMGLPAEEIVERDVAIFHLVYEDVTADNGDFTDGLAGVIYDNADGNAREGDAPGKLAMWAWANMRIMDYAMTLDCLDFERSAVIGHSRLGKTALLTGLLDERFRYIMANNSGCSGDALSRGNAGEQIADIVSQDRFHYWFCKNFFKYAETGYAPFDQHQLLAALAPRTVIVGAAKEDAWADPVSQYLSCVAASPAWKAFGKEGLVSPDRLPEAGDVFHSGSICYHLRDGTHYLSRHDWNHYIDVLLSKQSN